MVSFCAREGSKGPPSKNLGSLAGKPFVGWAIESAAAVCRLDRMIVSTDSEEIARVACSFGTEVPFMRPPELARDDSPEWLSWQHALRFLQRSEGGCPDALVSIQAAAPLRSISDIDRYLDEYERGDSDVVITVTDSHCSPFFNRVQRGPNGTVVLVIAPASALSRRQDAPVTYDITTVAYVLRSEFVLSHHALFKGRVRAVHDPLEHAVDIDTPLDFAIAEFLMSKRLG